VEDRIASRHHAVIRCGDGRVVIVDLGSRNGLFINGFPFETKVLVYGDHLNFGGEVFAFVDRDDVDEQVLKVAPGEMDEDTLPTRRAIAYAAAEKTIVWS
jgi:pSer/pThr/pTyr-binding forkhead associated (FHA) protein